MARDNYTKVVKLINKYSGNPITGPSIGAVSNGDLTNWLISMELVNSSVDRTDTCTLTLRTDPQGTFIRNGPILIDELAKYKYLIQAQISQGSKDGKLFRFEISDATLREDQANGEVLVITGRGLEYIFKETLDSEQLFFKTPKQAFIQRIRNYMDTPSFGSVEGVNQTITATYTDSNIDLPDQHDIKQGWVSSSPRTVMDQMNKIIKTLSEAGVSGGVMTDYFWDTNPNSTWANTFDIFAKKYGHHNSADGLVTISPIDIGGGEQKDKVWRTDNQRFKNLVIVKGARGQGTLPMNHCRFRSEFEHARRRPDWVQSGTYTANESYVKFEVSGQDKFYKCIQSSSASNPKQPNLFSSYWQEDVTTTADDLNPWLKDRKDQIRSLANPSPDKSLFESSSGAGDGYVGFAPDWNIVRGNYDRNFNNEFQHLSIKWVTRISNTPPTGKELFHGQRILVGTSPSGDFSGNANKIAQYDRYPDPNALTVGLTGQGTPVWRFSNAPQNNDVVVNLDTGELLKWNTANSNWGTGSNTSTARNVNTDLANKKAFSIQDHGTSGYGSADGTAPLHLVKDIQTVEGATKGVNSASQWTFDWRILNGRGENKNSRGAWWYMMFPYPRVADSSATNSDVGSVYGGTNVVKSWLNRNNLDYNSKGQKGWNHGTDSEDLGVITGVSFKIKLEVLYDKLQNGTLSLTPSGFHNTKHTIWFMDMFDRIMFAKFELRRNGGWQFVRIPLGQGMKRHFNRLDEQSLFMGYDLVGDDWYLPEREYTGIAFDWRFIKAVGIQWDHSYAKSEFGQYTGWQLALAKDAMTSGTGATTSWWLRPFLGIVGTAVTVAQTQDESLYDIDKVRYTIDEFKFEKDLYVSSLEGTTPESGARTSAVEESAQAYDYLTAKRIAQGRRERLKFFPQDYTVTCFGDVRVRVGDKVRIKGTKVPSTTTDGGVPYFDIGVQEVKHILDANSYRMVITGTRKFVI